MAVAALVVDFSIVVLATQRCQDVADAAALAGGPLLEVPATAIQTAQAIVVANNTNQNAFAVTSAYVAGSSTSDIIVYGPGETVPQIGTLGAAPARCASAAISPCRPSSVAWSA